MRFSSALFASFAVAIGAIACSSSAGSEVLQPGTGDLPTTPTDEGTVTPGEEEEGKPPALPATCPCPVESYCDLSSNTCKAGCTRDEECKAGRFCDEATRTCADGCRTVADCKAPANGDVACAEGMCKATCDARFHACGAACKADTDPTACGTTCTACPIRTNATASCEGGACKSACNAGFHECAGACASSTSPLTCGASCTPCPGVANGAPTCDGGACGIKCNAGYVPDGNACVRDCVVTGCGAFQWCDATATHLCKAGCERHDECGSAQFCKIATHTCENTTSGQRYCPAGFVARGRCSDGRDMCVNASLPAGTQHVFGAACPGGTTARGSTNCSGDTWVCVPNDP